MTSVEANYWDLSWSPPPHSPDIRSYITRSKENKPAASERNDLSSQCEDKMTLLTWKISRSHANSPRPSSVVSASTTHFNPHTGTCATIQAQWACGKLPDSAVDHPCYFGRERARGRGRTSDARSKFEEVQNLRYKLREDGQVFSLQNPIQA